MNLTNQQTGSLLAFTAIMFITPDSLLIRLSNVESWNLIFYRGIIPFFAVLIGLLIIQKGQFISSLISNGWRGIAYSITFTITNIFPGLQGFLDVIDTVQSVFSAIDSIFERETLPTKRSLT